MPYLRCKLRKNWCKVSNDVCFEMKCPHFKFGEYSSQCTFPTKPQKSFFIIICIGILFGGFVLGQFYRAAQVEPYYQTQIETLEDQLRINKHDLRTSKKKLGDLEIQLGLLQGKGKKKQIIPKIKGGKENERNSTIIREIGSTIKYYS